MIFFLFVHNSFFLLILFINSLWHFGSGIAIECRNYYRMEYEMNAYDGFVERARGECQLGPSVNSIQSKLLIIFA